LLARQRIYCATPGKLNDPWDCRPWFDASLLQRDPAELEKYLDFLYNSTNPRPPIELRRQHDDLMRSDPVALEQTLARYSRIVQVEIACRRIYCLTPHPDNILMWSHYAEDHKGICLQFDTNVQLFGTAWAVKYLEDYPSLTAHVMTFDGVLPTILTKSDVWEYEHEFRILGTPQQTGLPIQLDGNYLPIGNALSGIILGCEADNRTILKFMKGHAPDLPVYRAARENSQYRLKIVEFSDHEIACQIAPPPATKRRRP
jgi:hypothetical protein